MCLLIFKHQNRNAMKYKELAKIIIGMQNLDIADDLERRFRLSKDMKDTEMQELVSQLVEGGFASGLDNIVNNSLIDKIVSKAVMELGLLEDRFDRVVNGMCVEVIYDNEYVYDWQDLERIAEERRLPCM